MKYKFKYFLKKKANTILCSSFLSSLVVVSMSACNQQLTEIKWRMYNNIFQQYFTVDNKYSKKCITAIMQTWILNKE